MDGIWKYSDFLPPVKEEFKITLGEGGTPLVKSNQIGPSLGLDNLYFKLELANPTGSYKDRFAASAVSDLLQQNSQLCLSTSSGNTGSALAAYCAAAGLNCYLAIIDGTPSGKLQQMQVYGSKTMMIKDFGKNPIVSHKVLSELKIIAEKFKTSVQISAFCYSPLGMSGVQTIAYEIAEILPDGSGNIFSPAGGGGLTLALTKGFQSWQKHHLEYKIPKVNCVQPLGNNTIAGPLRDGMNKAQQISRCTTSMSGLQVPTVLDGHDVISNCRATGGTGYTVTDELIFECQEKLAGKEGIFCEPAGAVALAGLITALGNNEIDNKTDPVVCLVTGHGFKDPASADRMAGKVAKYNLNRANELFDLIESQNASRKKVTYEKRF